MIFMIGWASGGVFFGILGDRIGRAKTMMLTILFYSLFTGLSVLSTNVWDFSFYRFLTGWASAAVRGRRGAGGRGDARPRAAVRPGLAAGAVGVGNMTRGV